MSLTSRHSSRLADYFVISGLDFTSGLEPNRITGDLSQCSPLERSYKCKVLEHYPANVSWNPFDKNAVCMLCLPHGLQFRTQKHCIEAKFHSFVITRQDGSRYYGFSVIFYEEVRNKKISTAMQTLQSMHLTEMSSKQGCLIPEHNNSRSLPRHFKVATHEPKAAQNYYDAAKDTLYVTKSIAVIMQLPYVKAAKKFLLNLHRYAMTKPVPNQLSVESYIYNFLYEIPSPAPGRSVQFYIVDTDETVTIQRPGSIEELPLLDFSLRELFMTLSVDTIVQLFTCLLLENQILLCSSDFHKLMLVAECLSSLLFPFQWQHVYVPVLPASLLHFLDAPVPFIMGLHSEEPQGKLASEANLCYLDIDNEVIHIPEELPSFPHRNEFCNELVSLLDKYNYTYRHSVQMDHSDIMSSSAIFTGEFADQGRRKHSWAHDSDSGLSTSESNNSSSALQKVVDIARRSGVEVDDVDGVTKSINSLRKDADEETELNELRFNNAARETFLNRFIHIFHTYEHFVLLPEDKEEYLSNKDSLQNFDKATFLSDQPAQHLPFLSQFLETQMFASLIDNKIMFLYNDVDTNLRVFDRRIKNFNKRNSPDDQMLRIVHYEPCNTIRSSQLMIEKRQTSVDVKVSRVKEIMSEPANRLPRTPKSFPPLDTNVLNKEPAAKSRRRSCSVQWRTQRKYITDNSSNAVDSSRSSLPRDIKSEVNRNPTKLDVSPALIAQVNWTFVETLLKDCKNKTKRMLLEKMSAEGLVLESGEQLGDVEENTLIASLCDLLERIWSHAVQHKQGKSALWNHLLNFQELEECNETAKPMDQTILTPDLSSLALELDTYKSNDNTSPCVTPDSRSLDRRSLDRRHDVPALKPLPVSVTYDIRNVQAMSEIKSQIGYARAWVRLSLEKKLLSRHLRTLLSDISLLKSLYKRNAFLRCEDEKEQFLYHLLSLNAVDYYCFTNTYTSKLPYRVVIFPSRKSSSSTTTANSWVAVSGTSGETSQIPVPKGTLDFLFHHKNLGLLTTLRIGHDNSGLSPNWMIENVVVRCEVTGHTYRFPCGRYLGKSVDDGSTERLLVGELMKQKSEETVDPYSTPPRCRSPQVSRRDVRLSVAEIQHMIGDSVNNIVKYFYRHNDSTTSNRIQDTGNSLTSLLCGEMGLVHSLEQAFLLGFKATRLFGRNLYLWDYFLRVKEQFDSVLTNESHSHRASSSDQTRPPAHTYNSNRINNNNQLHQSEWTDGCRRRDIERIPRANSAQLNCDTRRYNLMQQNKSSNDRRTSKDRNNTTGMIETMKLYCELTSRIENTNRTIGKDGKFQRFVCLGAREHLLHRMLQPMSSTSVTLEMYDDNSFLRSSNLRTFLTDILSSLDEFEFDLESSITSGIDVT